MVDYTTSKGGSGSGFGLLLGAAVVVLIMLYAIYAGGDAGTTVDPATLEQTAPAATDSTAPVLD